jgi:hypothetical protein
VAVSRRWTCAVHEPTTAAADRPAPASCAATASVTCRAAARNGQRSNPNRGYNRTSGHRPRGSTASAGPAPCRWRPAARPEQGRRSGPVNQEGRTAGRGGPTPAGPAGAAAPRVMPTMACTPPALASFPLLRRMPAVDGLRGAAGGSDLPGQGSHICSTVATPAVLRDLSWRPGVTVVPQSARGMSLPRRAARCSRAG